MKMLLLTVGTRGDVQPYVALGKGLQAKGYDVTICTSVTFKSFINAHGLNYVYMNDEIIRFIDSDAGRKAMESADNLLSFIKLAIQLTKDIKPVYRQMLDEAWTAAQGSDVIIYHPKAQAGYHIAEKLGIPGFLTIPFPVYVPTGEFPAVVFPNWKFGSWYNRFSYFFATRMSQAALGGTVNTWREETLHLQKRSFLANELISPNGKAVPVIHCYSPHVLQQPEDWPETAIASGYWFLERQDNWQPSEALLTFLADGSAPIYVGFGSISGSNPEKTTRIILDAIKLTGQRAILATGWGGLDANNLPDSVFPVDSVPHDWLFPQMSAVIHHGGAGTTAAGLRAGIPTIICSFFGDQPFWGNRVAKLGVGPNSIPQKKLTAKLLANAIDATLNNSQIRHQASELGMRIRSEDGIENAIAFIEKYIDQMKNTAHYRREENQN